MRPSRSTVDGQTNTATNNGTTWTLTDDTLSALALGIFDVSVTATDAAGNVGSDATTGELEIITELENWRRDNFTTAELADPTISGPEANPDGDARPNLFEFLHVSDPTVFDIEDPVQFRTQRFRPDRVELHPPHRPQRCHAHRPRFEQS